MRPEGNSDTILIQSCCQAHRTTDRKPKYSATGAVCVSFLTNLNQSTDIRCAVEKLSKSIHELSHQEKSSGRTRGYKSQHQSLVLGVSFHACRSIGRYPKSNLRKKARDDGHDDHGPPRYRPKLIRHTSYPVPKTGNRPEHRHLVRLL